MSDIRVQLVAPLRLMAAILASGTWPEREQAIVPHAVHAQARQTRHFLREANLHPAVTQTDETLAQDGKMDALFSRVLVDAGWQRLLQQFDRDTALSRRFWPAQDEIWQAAVMELNSLIPGQSLAQFLSQCASDALESLILITPNLLYPALTPVLARAPDQVVLLLPPPKAIGESPPWPYVEDPGWVLTHVCQRLIAHVARTELATVSGEHQALAVHAATALFLEISLGPAERLAYEVAVRKQQNLKRLPEMIEQLRAGPTGPGSLLANLKF